MLVFGGLRVPLDKPLDPSLLVVPHVLICSACVSAAEVDPLVPQLDRCVKSARVLLAGLNLLEAIGKAGHGSLSQSLDSAEISWTLSCCSRWLVAVPL